MIQESFFSKKAEHLADICACKISAQSIKPFLRKRPFILNWNRLFRTGLNVIPTHISVSVLQMLFHYQSYHAISNMRPQSHTIVCVVVMQIFQHKINSRGRC